MLMMAMALRSPGHRYAGAVGIGVRKPGRWQVAGAAAHGSVSGQVLFPEEHPS